MDITGDEALYYSSQSRETDPADLGQYLDPLPKDPKQLLHCVGGLVLHRAFVGPAGITCPPESADDMESRRMPDMIKRILARDPGSLINVRRPEKRLIGVCRHYALLACSVFRRHGVPSRLRVGFADYFDSGFHDDHWVTEYWDSTSWRLMDPELTPDVQRHFAVTFDPCNVPRDRFLVAGAAWRFIGSGKIDPAKCGVSTLGISGEWFVAASVVRDLAALNKREMLPWDYWGIVRDMGPGITISEAIKARIHNLADLIAGPDPNWNAIRDIYEQDESLKVPRVVLSYPHDLPIEVAV